MVEPVDRAERGRLAGAVAASLLTPLPPRSSPTSSRGETHVSPRVPSSQSRPGASAKDAMGKPLGFSKPFPTANGSRRCRLSEIGLDHARVMLHVLRRALGDLLTV